MRDISQGINQRCGRSDSQVSIGPRDEVFYYRLFKYTQQHTACFTENSIGPRTS